MLTFLVSVMNIFKRTDKIFNAQNFIVIEFYFGIEFAKILMLLAGDDA
jgi:hypothetical protein